MCGITGYLDLELGVDIATLEKMNTIIQHRGPDDEGYSLFTNSQIQHYHGDDSVLSYEKHILEEDGKGFFLGFGHRRLSILDISEAGHQPMTYEDSENYITFNGEIYNYIEIRHELQDKGYKFQTDCDTEVILASYIAWGEECVVKFNGMWAFCIFNKKENLLFCSRDRMGQKPFHYYFSDKKFIFGSELKQLCEDKTLKRKINEPVLSAALVFGFTDYNEETLIQDFVQVKAAHNLVLTISNGGLQKKEYRYWDLIVNPVEMREDEIYQKVSEAYSDSVKLRLRSDVPVGALLSGGLDSSCMVTEIANQYKADGLDTQSFQTFTACYENDEKNDESYFAELVNRHNNVTQNFVYPDIDNVEKQYEEIVWALEGFGNFSFLGVNEVISKAAEKDIRVVLNGQNGDETMFGYEKYYAILFRQLVQDFDFDTLVKELKLAERNSIKSMSFLFPLLFRFEFWKLRLYRAKNRSRPFLTPLVDAHLDLKLCRNLLCPNDLNTYIYNEFTALQLSHILRYDDRMYMKHSIESRIPFIDYRFIELSCQIQTKEKIKNGYTKYILRKIFDEKMPKEVTWRINKMGFQSPTERWTKNYSKEYLEDLLTNPRSGKYFHMEHIRKEIFMNINSSMSVKFITLELFMRLFDVE